MTNDKKMNMFEADKEFHPLEPSGNKRTNIFEDDKGFYRLEPSGNKRRLCPHKRRKSRCRDCCGGSICDHDKRRDKCRECKELKKSMNAFQNDIFGFFGPFKNY